MFIAVSKFTLLVLLPIAYLFSTSLVQAQPDRIAIIIDDIGYRYTDQHALSLPGAITYSILPHTPYGKKIAIKAKAKHKDVMLHIPMEAENGKKLGPGSLTSTMNKKQILFLGLTSLLSLGCTQETDQEKFLLAEKDYEASAYEKSIIQLKSLVQENETFYHSFSSCIQHYFC
mgnify:CR=1 FL=1